MKHELLVVAGSAGGGWKRPVLPEENGSWMKDHVSKFSKGGQLVVYP